MAVAFALLFLLLASPAVYAVDHVVGGSSGWTNGADYSTWASGETFTVGDNLVFNYGFLHGVDEVSQSDYSSCTAGNAINSYNGGSTTIPLTKAGPMYFLCPTSGHCGQGMKLAITVKASGSPGGSPPSGGSSPTPPTTPSGGTTTPTPSTSNPTPKTSPNDAAGSFGSINHLMLGLSLVLGALLAFRG